VSAGSALFPYTTLFRSGREVIGVGVVGVGLHPVVGGEQRVGVHQASIQSGPSRRFNRRTSASDSETLHRSTPAHSVAAFAWGTRDRKSTRLNSSHVKIS